MKSGPRMGFKRWLVILASLPSVGLGCGIDWTLPSHHFSGVSSQGYVDIWDKIGKLDLGNGLILPLHIEFESNKEGKSGTLGAGWFFPILEAYVVQEDENTFRLYQPDGLYRYFWRDKNNPNILNGQGGWKAEVGNNTLTAWADCGWRLVYTGGKLTSMKTSDGRVLTWNYGVGGTVASIKEGNISVLEVARDPVTMEVIELVLKDHGKIGIEKAQRPKVQVIDTQKVVGGVEPSLSKITLLDGKVKTYEFGVNQNLNPTLTLDKERVITWDPKTKRVTQDGTWVYQIEAIQENSSFAKITRKNDLGLTEYWFNNVSQGVETTGINGTLQVTYRFVSGKAVGTIRKVEKVNPSGEVTLLTQNIVDENGRVIVKRKLGEEDVIITYDDLGKIKTRKVGPVVYEYTEGKLTSAIKDGKEIFKLKYSQN